MARPLNNREPVTRASAYLLDRQLDRLRAESLMTGTPLAALVRRAIDAAFPPPQDVPLTQKLLDRAEEHTAV